MTTMADWLELPGDILAQVLKRLPVSYRLRCGAVCTSWQRVEFDSRCISPAHIQVPGLMVSAGPDSEARMFYSLAEKKIYNTNLLLLPFSGRSLKCLGIFPAGWFLIIDYENDESGLFNPFSQTRIPLPHITKLMDPRKPHDEVPLTDYPHVWGAASSGDLDESKMIVIINLGIPDKLAFARPGDESWTLIVKKIGRRTWHKVHGKISDIILFKEHFYAVDHYGILYQCDDIGGNDPKIIVVASFKFPRRATNPPYFYRGYHLVESLGNLFIVIRTMAITKAEDEKIPKHQDPKRRHQDVSSDFEYSDEEEEEEDDPVSTGRHWDIIDDHKVSQQMVDYSNYVVEDHLKYRTVNFDVFKVDMDARKCVKVKTLEDCAFVLGWHTSFSVSAPHVNGHEPNSIYFIDACSENQMQGGHDNGVFCLEDGSIEPIYSHPTDLFDHEVPVPLWFHLIPS